MTAAPARRRWAAWGLSLCAAAVLAGCAGGSARPKPAELPPNAALVGVRQAWTARLPAVGFPLQVNVLGQQVTLAGTDGTIVTLDATSGRVFVLGADRSLSAFDGRNGARLWHLDRPAEPLVLRQAGMLQAVGNTLVAGMAGRLVGVDPDTGTVRWEAPLASARGTNDVERLIDLVGGVSRDGDVLCARSFQTAVGCVDTASGNLKWTKPASGATGLAGDGQRLFGTESDGRVLAWRAETGDRAWATDALQWRQLTGPLVLGRSVIVGDSTGLVHMLSREDGSPLNRLATDGSGIAATPVVAGNTLVVVTRSGGVYGFVPE